MKVAVTGGAGFIGGRVVAAHLARGDSVRLLTRRPPSARSSLEGDAVWVQGDLGGPTGELADFVAGCDVLYHCAGEVRDPEQMQRVHVVGTRRLIDSAAGRIGRWVQLSSVGAYGPQRDGTVTEETPLRPVGPYEETKAAADGLVEEAHRAGRIAATIVRPSIVFGPGMSNASVRQWISMVRRRLFFFIGRAGASANYVPVESTVEALLLCATHPSALGAVFNVSDHASIENFVGWIADECGVPHPRIRVPAPPIRAAAAILGRLPGWPLTPSRVAAMTTRVRFSQTKLERVLGFAPSVSFEAATRAMARDYLETVR